MKHRSEHFLFFSDMISENTVLFSEEEARHIATVLRITNGAPLFSTDGKGAVYSLIVKEITKKGILAQIVEKKAIVKPLDIVLNVALPERECFEKLITSVVPHGVVKIVPVIADYCQKPWWDRDYARDLQRFTRLSIAAAKQSWNPWFPTIEVPCSFEKALKESPENVLYGDEYGLNPLSVKLSIKEDSPIALFVGPPGGFSDTELSSLSNGGTGITLSTYRLRTELAASDLTAIAALLAQKKDHF